MPTVSEHLTQADANVAFFEKQLEAEELSWAVVALFYAAVHLGRAAAVAKGFGPFTSHYEFENRLRRDLRAPQHIWNAYRELKDEAEAARYDIRTFAKEAVTKLRNLKFAVFDTWARNQTKA